MGNVALSMWNRFSRLPGGKALFSRAVSIKTPYFRSIAPQMIELRPGYCEARMRKRWSVTNHIGTVHAIAMCNLAEFCGGLLTEVSVPADTHRWIPKGMTVEYIKKAETDLRAVSELPRDQAWPEALELPVTVNVTDAAGELVFRAVIRMWVTAKKAR